VVRTGTGDLLLGEWACLGVLYRSPAHGYDVSVRLAPSGGIGRVWSLSRPLTYRALDQLVQRGLVVAIGEEKGRAGGQRTILAPTRGGRAALRRWLHEPVPHVRDVRSDLLLKLLLCDLDGIDPVQLLVAQRSLFEPMVDGLGAAGGPSRSTADPVDVWRYESSRAVLRFLDRMLASTGSSSPGSSDAGVAPRGSSTWSNQPHRGSPGWRSNAVT
jgi:PadR family transcriptional regulator AphA